MSESKYTYNTRVKLCEDGRYRWIYEMSLLKNPTILFLIIKIFFAIFLVIFGVTTIADFIRFKKAEALFNNAKVLGIIFLVFMAIVIISYLIYTAVMGGKYIIEFEMDEKGVNHKQIPFQAEKARKIGEITALAGSAKGSFTTTGIGMNATRTEMYSDFSKTRKVKSYPRRNLIKVNGLLSRNQVYAMSEDFEFVKDYIISHCENLKK
ncbi:MAG: hypothetical protein IJM37_04275 [Lachnospiraceae bacterium]|nr:hypothetical protein [Lachnospiraceae bacterium]